MVISKRYAPGAETVREYENRSGLDIVYPAGGLGEVDSAVAAEDLRVRARP